MFLYCSLTTTPDQKNSFEKSCQTACKPGSVPVRRRGMTIPLGRPLPDASRDRPGWRGGNASDPEVRHPYLVLLPVGFALPPPLPAARCALTAPFHPCRPANRVWRYVSVALSLRSPSPDVIRHRISVEPGLSSPRGSGERPSGRLAEQDRARSGRGVNPVRSDSPAHVVNAAEPIFMSLDVD